METKFKLLDGIAEQFGLTPSEIVEHYSKKIDMPTIIPAKRFVTPKHIEAGMFHYAEENLIFPEIIPELVIDSVIGCWDKNSGIGICRDQNQLPWSSEGFKVGNDHVKSGFEATQMILSQAKREGKIAEAAQFCAEYAGFGVTPGQAFMFSKYEAEKIGLNTFRIDEAFALLQCERLRQYLWLSSEYDIDYAWDLCTNATLTGGLYGKTSKDYNGYVRPALAVTI